MLANDFTKYHVDQKQQHNDSGSTTYKVHLYADRNDIRLYTHISGASVNLTLKKVFGHENIKALSFDLSFLVFFNLNLTFGLPSEI